MEMPVTKSAKKALRSSRRKEAVNKSVKEILRKVLREVRRKPTNENWRQASRVLDQAAKKKVIHKNKAARLKSRLVKLLGKKTPPATTKIKTKKKKIAPKPSLRRKK